MIQASADSLLLLAVGLLVGAAAGRLLPRRGDRRGEAAADRAGFYKSLNYILSNEHDKAIEEFTRMVEVDSETVEVYLGLGSLFRSKGEVGRAIRIHQSIIVRPALDKRIKVQAYFDLALDYQKAGLFDSAIETFRTVIRLDPHHLEAYRRLEKIYEDEKSWGEALEIERQIRKLTRDRDPGVHAHLQTEIAKDLVAAGRGDEAVRVFRKAIQADPRCVDAYLHLGDLYASRGQHGKALALWEGVAERTPDYAFLTYPRIEKILAEQGRTEEIEGIYRRNAARNPADVQTRLRLGEYLLAKGETEAAGQVFEEAVRLRPDCMEAHRRLGEIHLVRGDLEAARRVQEAMAAVFARKSLPYHCGRCGFESQTMQWRCPQCKEWDTFVY